MKILYKNIFYLILVLFSLSACQSVKDGLTGKKQNNTDEFLVEKKNPLVLPPEFNKLPEPITLDKKDRNQEEIDLESILAGDSSKEKKVSASKVSDGSIEKSILEKIKSN
ncbi:DUF3035 domain-containing protein [Candidatus Pelagibacter sp.]|nr:DUF3035 domain-containing protein [Candidatus Pelagibacter sp.]|tara:strand:- start:2239 stop:2568 length:330 start_codon:yes stop_codon:yes gene_type:complete